jgi:hypothetical protein
MIIQLFENFDKSELFHNVKDCFQDLIDSEVAEFVDNEDLIEDFKSSIIVCCIIPKDKTDSTSFDEFFNQKKKHFNILSEIKSCLETLKQHHDDVIDINFDYSEDEDGELQINFYITEGTPEVGDFWKISNDGLLRLDYEKLKKYLKIPDSCQVSMSSTGSNKILSIYFKTEEELESHKEKLIKDILDFKIKGKEITAPTEWAYPASKPEDKGRYKIYKNYNRHRSTGYYDNRKDIVHYIQFSLNPEFNISW